MRNTDRKLPPLRMVHRDGGFNFVRKGVSSSNWRDPYHLLLTLSWAKFLGLLSVVYLLVNSLFAIAYLAGGDGIENAQPGNFLDTFFFSVQTMASIGYGSMYPKTLYVNILVTK